MKRCYKCEQTKELTEFWKCRGDKHGRQKMCITCTKEIRKSPQAKQEYKDWQANHARKAPGVLREDYDRLLQEQEGLCAICKCPADSEFNKFRLHLCVEHDHITDEVRGLVCDWCNVGLARFRDDPSLLRAAALYLESPNPEPILHYSKHRSMGYTRRKL